MTEPEKQQSRPHLFCVACGTPIARGDYCTECVDRGLGPCEACEGLSLLDVEEGAS